MRDRIEMTYEAIDEMINCHGLPRPDRFGGGKWDAVEEWKLYKKQVGGRYSPFQWAVMESYFNHRMKKFKEVKKKVKK